MANPRAAQLIEAGTWLRLSGDHEGARRLFEQALKLDPDNPQARQLLGAEPTPAAAGRSQPLAPAPSLASGDLDWGSATGFSPTPVPFIPPAAMREQPPPPAVVELDFEPLPPPVAGPSTLVFGQGAPLPDAPLGPSVPMDWARGGTSSPTMVSYPGVVAEFEDDEPGQPAQPTMLFSQPAAPEPARPRPASDPGGPLQAPPPQPPSRTIQFGQADLEISWEDPPPAGPPPSEPSFAPNATSAWDLRSNPGIKLNESAPGRGSALDLVTADRPAAAPPVVTSKLDEVRTLMNGAKDLLGLDDHTGAMDLILKAQELAPNDPEVQALRARSEATLEAMFESKLGALSSTPRVKLKDDEIIWLNLDHRAGFVLAQIDGQVTFEDLFSVSGMSRLDTARILAQLIEEGVITS